MKGNMRYAAMAVILVVALLMQPLWPAASRTTSAAGIPRADRVTPVPVQAAGDCAKIYLPLILKGARISAASADVGAMSPPAAAALIPGPEFAIISPRQGWTVSGMLFFAAQPRNSAGVSSVAFQAGSTDLGTDSTPADGFKVFLDADAFPAGPLQLTATASGPCGQLTKTITVNNVLNPPSSGIIGSQGGVFASQIGSIIAFPPGGAPDGTSITVTEKTQEQVTADTGIDWEALGVTFLGAQDVQASAPISSPLMVASAGFGPRVQPGQVVVNYNILPDVNGDGIDELVVVNTASVAPNDDVISDPVPQLALVSGEISSSAFNFRNLQNGISGPPGTVFKIQAAGFNLFSARGNVAIYRSSVDGTEIQLPMAIVDGLDVGAAQTLLTMIPSLPPGPATLRLRNLSTGSSLGPFPVTVETPAALTRPPEEILDEFLVLVSAKLDEIRNRLATQSEFSQAVEFIDLAKDQIPEAQALVQEMSNDPDLTEVLVEMASIVENSDFVAGFPGLQTGEVSQSESVCEAEDHLSDGWEMAGVKAMEVVGHALEALPDVLASSLAQALALAAIFWELAHLIELTTIIIVCKPRALPPAETNWSSRLTTGMGATVPTGGSGGGNAPTPPENGGTSSPSLQSSATDQVSGRVIVKVASAGGNGFPFSGATDAGGYFFIPLIPENEPFVATAIDTLTGQMREFEGVGPPVGKSVFMVFDFFSGDTGSITPLQFGEVISASIASPTEVDAYSFQGTADDQVFLRTRPVGTVFPVCEVFRPDGTLLCPPFGYAGSYEQTCGLDATGTYTLLCSDAGSNDTGAYQLYLQRLNSPAMATGINFGQTVTGTLDFIVDLGTHTFNGTTGDRVLFRMSEASETQPLQPQFWIFRPNGTPLCDAYSLDSYVAVEQTCILDASGIHSILAGGWAAQSLNPYALYLQRLNNPSQVTPTSFGEVKSGMLDILAKADTYRFDGISGDQVIVRMARTATLPSSPYAFWPNFHLYREDGTELCSNFGGLLAEATCVLDVTGPYTILARNRQGIGSYNLFIQATNSPANATPIAYGNTLSGTLAVASVMDTYAFSGTAGDQILVRMTETSTVLEPEVRVYRPNSTLLCSIWNATIAEVQCTLDINGTYTLLAGDNLGEDTGTYDIFLNRTN